MLKEELIKMINDKSEEEIINEMKHTYCPYDFGLTHNCQVGCEQCWKETTYKVEK